MRAPEISRSALDVEWQRLQVVASNLANINTSRTENGEPFRPMRLVSGPRAGFGDLVAGGLPGGVAVRGVETVQGNARRVYEPAHPHADAEGFVTYPAIDLAGEMTLLIRTARAYEANLTAISIAHQMYARAMQLGHQS